jgi:DNA-binding GntR family transcriptional regulator
MQGLIVETANRRGVMVAPLDAAFVGWLYELRAALDSAAARAAARRPRPELREEGTAILKAGRAAIAAGDLDRLVKADLRFHLFVYEAAGNPLLLDTARQHWHHTRRAMGAYVRRATAMGNVWGEHAAILDAVVAGDGERAAQLSHEHAANSVRTLLAESAPTNEPDEPAASGRSERAASSPGLPAASSPEPTPNPSPRKRRHG